jgi:hypothetical protein
MYVDEPLMILNINFHELSTLVGSLEKVKIFLIRVQIYISFKAYLFGAKLLYYKKTSKYRIFIQYVTKAIITKIIKTSSKFHPANAILFLLSKNENLLDFLLYGTVVFKIIGKAIFTSPKV